MCCSVWCLEWELMEFGVEKRKVILEYWRGAKIGCTFYWVGSWQTYIPFIIFYDSTEVRFALSMPLSSLYWQGCRQWRWLGVASSSTEQKCGGKLGLLSVAATTLKGSVHRRRDLVLHVTVPPGTGKCIYIEIICQLAQPFAISSLFSSQ